MRHDQRDTCSRPRYPVNLCQQRQQLRHVLERVLAVDLGDAAVGQRSHWLIQIGDDINARQGHQIDVVVTGPGPPAAAKVEAQAGPCSQVALDIWVENAHAPSFTVTARLITSNLAGVKFH